MKISLIVCLFITFPFFVLSQISISSFRRLDLPSTSKGPIDTTFDSRGRLYTGISDGRILRYDNDWSRFLDLYITSPNRTGLVCDGTNDPARLGLTCGRPNGLGFYVREQKLYIADSYRGLLVARAPNRLAVPVISNETSGGVKFGSGLDVDQLTGDVYYTIASTRFTFSQLQMLIQANDATGKLLKYNPRSNQVTLVLGNLSGPAGVALSLDRSYVLVTEFTLKRIIKYWLTGPRASTSRVIATFQGGADKIKRNIDGDFWVAVTEMRPNGITSPRAILINGNGRVLSTLDLSRFYLNDTLTSFHQSGLRYYTGSLEPDFLGIIN